MRPTVVTTFSPQGYQCYGRAFVQSFLQQEKEALLVCYHESMDVDQIAPNLEWRNLDADMDRKQFIAEHGSDPAKVSDARFPNHQSIRFCHKVFAITHAARLKRSGWLVWLDSDVVITGKPEWDDVLPATASLAFLGRPHYAYTECGFVGYQLDDQRVQKMLEDMRSYYVSGEIFTRPDRDHHDSRCFDICRERSGIPNDRQHNISRNKLGTHVWPLTPLQKWSTHNKGPGRKRSAYGSIA